MAGDLPAAGDLLDAALALATEVGEPYVTARARLAAGLLATERAEHERALGLLAAARAEFAALDMPVWRDRAGKALQALGERQADPH
ncbi:hypothetical protein [Nonomuraea salmonea]